MLTRRDFLARSLKASTLLACTPAVPQFLAATARAAEQDKDGTVLVVLEMGGGNDGLNTVIPYADDLYHRARPTLRITKKNVLKVDDHVGLHSSLSGLQPMLNDGRLAVVQGVGYPNPDRSHFESMDIWQSADLSRATQSGWLGRAVPSLHDKKGSIPALQIGPNQLPLALQGAPGGVVSLNQQVPYQLDLGGDNSRHTPRRKLIEDLTKVKDAGPDDDLLNFVRRRQVQTYATLDKLREVLESTNKNNAQPAPVVPGGEAPSNLNNNLNLVARLIKQGFGTRVFYVAIDGFDTHANQADRHSTLLQELGTAVGNFFQTLKEGDHDKKVVLMTFSEFGRRVKENGSRGTDHGAGSCLFVAGPAVQGGPVGPHPKLDDLDSGDVKHSIDFRRVYATLLDEWLGVDSRAVLNGQFERLPLLKKAEKS
ncbi:MAG TPA: DUF1501 domain-containing protein [Gemmataceae bacterium]|nr:DUF1501 domain-containing protein [Gemmataceae bacterium]